MTSPPAFKKETIPAPADDPKTPFKKESLAVVRDDTQTLLSYKLTKYAPLSSPNAAVFYMDFEYAKDDDGVLRCRLKPETLKIPPKKEE